MWVEGRRNSDRHCKTHIKQPFDIPEHKQTVVILNVDAKLTKGGKLFSVPSVRNKDGDHVMFNFYKVKDVYHSF